MDLSLNSKGDCTGTIAQGKDTIGIIKIGKTVYLRPQGTSKWTKANTASADGKDLASVCDLNSFLDGLQGERHRGQEGRGHQGRRPPRDRPDREATAPRATRWTWQPRASRTS